MIIRGAHILQWMNSLIQYIKLLFKYFFFNPYTNTSYFFQRICFCSNFVVQISCKIAFHFFWKWYQIGFYILAFNRQKCSKLAFVHSVFATIFPEFFLKILQKRLCTYILVLFSENIFIRNSLTIRGNCHSVFLPDLGGAVLVFAIWLCSTT